MNYKYFKIVTFHSPYIFPVPSLFLRQHVVAARSQFLSGCGHLESNYTVKLKISFCFDRRSLNGRHFFSRVEFYLFPFSCS